jgi:hypothetical protein
MEPPNSPNIKPPKGEQCPFGGIKASSYQYLVLGIKSKTPTDNDPGRKRQMKKLIEVTSGGAVQHMGIN